MKGTTVFSGVAVAAALLVAPGALAQEVVWDSPVNPDLAAFVDQQFPNFPDFSTYIVAHVSFERDTFIHEITTYYTNGGNLWPLGATNATLNIIAQDGLPPNSHDPSPGAGGISVDADMVLGANGLEMTHDAAGGITLAAGDYWIGLTPNVDFLAFGQEFHQGTDNFAKNSAARNPGGGFGVGTDWFDAGVVFGGINWGAAITITGKNVPTPGALALLGLAGLLTSRRRRR